MKSILDRFSTQANAYEQHRPKFPSSLLKRILDFVPERTLCWDCGTGNGQLAEIYASYFNQVIATDISSAQLNKTPSKTNVIYQQARVEQSGLQEKSVDLIVIGQALHWFDWDMFYREARRVAKPGAILAAFGYGILQVDVVVNRYIDRFYTRRIGKYWDRERIHIEQEYRNIPFPFSKVPFDKPYFIVDNWSRDQLEGYLNSWSSVAKCKQKEGRNPVVELIHELGQENIWKAHAKKDVKFPVFYLLGKLS